MCDLIHRAQEVLALGLLILSGILGIGEGQMFHRVQLLSLCEVNIPPNLDAFFGFSLRGGRLRLNDECVK